MKKFILMMMVLGIFLGGTAQANLSLSPFYVQFDANSPKRTDLVRMTNTSNEKKTYRIKLINYKQMEDGSYKEISQPLPGNPFAAPYIGYSPHETTLDPHQSQTIRIQRKPMAAAPNGEYVSHMLMQETSGQTVGQTKLRDGEIKIDLKAIYGVSIPIIIDKGDLSSSASITKAKVVRQANYPYAEVMVKRSGNQSFWGTLIVKDGKEEIGRVNSFKIFLSTPQRLIKIPLSRNPSQKVHLILMNARTDATISSQDI